MTDKVKKAIEQSERISNSLASIGETVDYTDIAIQALETSSCIKEKCAYCPHCEHCDVDDETLAIKALEQQSCEDCISREALRQKLQEHHNFFVNAYGSFKDMTFKEKARVDEIDNCIAMVINEPSVTPSYNSIKPELKPCEDCISRQVVKDMLTAEWTKYMPMELDINLSFVLDKISVLPSVTPQPKTGHWIDIMVGDMQAQACDQCKTFYPLAYTGGGHIFCPNCGAKMIESEEEEC